MATLVITEIIKHGRCASMQSSYSLLGMALQSSSYVSFFLCAVLISCFASQQCNNSHIFAYIFIIFCPLSAHSTVHIIIIIVSIIIAKSSLFLCLRGKIIIIIYTGKFENFSNIYGDHIALHVTCPCPQKIKKI